MNDTQSNNETRKLFFVLISFTGPQEGRVQVAARDKDHAIELATQLMEHTTDLKIIDVFSEDELEPKQQSSLIIPETSSIQ